MEIRFIFFPSTRDLKEEDNTNKVALQNRNRDRDRESAFRRRKKGGFDALSLSLALSHSQHCAVDVSDAFTRNTRNKRLGEN